MGLFELLLLSVGLAMDAFAVSICKGLAVKKITAKEYLLCGLWFGTFQGIMPLIGYLVGSRFERFITMVAPWVAFILLSLIGGNMIKEAFAPAEEVKPDFDVTKIKEIAEYMLSKDAKDYDEEKLALYINLIPEDVEGLNKLRSEIESLVNKYEKITESRPRLI